MISLYHDGELPSPWKEKMQDHLESCSECKAVFSGYDWLGEYLHTASAETAAQGSENRGPHPQDEAIKAAQERVWNKLTAPELVVGRAGESRWAGTKPWNLRITLPLPVAAAAVLVIVLSLAFAVLRAKTPAPSLPQDTMAGISSMGLNEQGMFPMHDITEVLQYLSSQDSTDIMVIRLPETRSFSRIGEPELINAADYSRRNSFR